MDPPDIKTVFRDEERKITFEIWAYRKVTEAEALAQISLFLGEMKRKKQQVKSGETYGILTSYH